MGWNRAYRLIKEEDYRALLHHMTGELIPEVTIWKACYHIAIEYGMPSQELVYRLYMATIERLKELS